VQLLTGTSYDCGRKLGYMQAFVSYGLRNNDQGRDFRESIQKILAK
jgi:UTP--glucose-1-phosphate uridylyltransferase